jgi:prolyl 4-hydroxylase
MNNFILDLDMKDLSICDELIEYHKISPDKKRGTVYDNGRNLEDPKQKSSTDTYLPNGELSVKYIQELQECVIKYSEKYSYSTHYGRWTLTEPMNIQHYAPGEGFFNWHTERTCNATPEVFRHLVFMTYLNDVDDGGETEFFYQDVKFKPKKGKTLLWPADWTHTHRGVTSLTQEKYIITGWFSFF